MSHNCKTSVVYCMDWRLSPGQANLDKALLESNIVEPGFDRVVIGGAAKNLASPKEASDVSFVIRQLDIADKLHHIERVVLINHTDCGAYGGSSQFDSSESEHKFHGEELYKACSITKESFPNLVVESYLAVLSEHDGQWSVELKRS